MIPNTANYNLKQWGVSDKPAMEDFNETNQRIDTALKSLADKDKSVDTALTTLSEK